MASSLEQTVDEEQGKVEKEFKDFQAKHYSPEAKAQRRMRDGRVQGSLDEFNLNFFKSKTAKENDKRKKAGMDLLPEIQYHIGEIKGDGYTGVRESLEEFWDSLMDHVLDNVMFVYAKHKDGDKVKEVVEKGKEKHREAYKKHIEADRRDARAFLAHKLGLHAYGLDKESFVDKYEGKSQEEINKAIKGMYQVIHGNYLDLDINSDVKELVTHKRLREGRFDKLIKKLGDESDALKAAGVDLHVNPELRGKKPQEVYGLIKDIATTDGKLTTDHFRDHYNIINSTPYEKAKPKEAAH